MTHDQQRVFVQNALEQLPLIKVRRFMTESLSDLAIFDKTTFPIPGTDVTVAFEFQDNNVHFCRFYLTGSQIPTLRITNHEWNVLPYTALTVSEMAQKIDFFMKVLGENDKELSLNKFEQLLSEEPNMSGPYKYEVSREIGRQRFPGEEKKLFEIPVFCRTPTDSGHVPIFGYAFPGNENDFLKNVRLAPVVKTVSHKDFFLGFLIDYDYTKVSLPLSYCLTLTREEFGQRFELCSKKTHHLRAMSLVLHGIECVEELLGKIPTKFIEPVVDAYIQSNYPSLYKKISDGKTILYSQNKRGECPKVSIMVSDVDKSKKKILLEKFVGECILKKEWPSMTQREAIKTFHSAGPEKDFER